MTRVLELDGKSGVGLHVPGREFLGPILASGADGVQLLDVDKLLPAEIDRLLFGSSVPALAGEGIRNAQPLGSSGQS